MVSDIRDALQALPRPPAGAGYAIAYSGGVDSTVLLHLALSDERVRPLRAIHVRHDLHPGAAAWSEHCARQCSEWGVELACIPVTVPRDSGLGVEAAARRVRYDALRADLAPDEVLLLAHHGDDQAETFLLQALRGAGVRGLASMPASAPFGDGVLARPLLGFGRAEILAYAREQGLDWIEDPSNRDPGLDRSYLRSEVWPAVVQRWPHAADTLGRSAAWCAEAAALQREWAMLDLQACFADSGLDVERLRALSGPRRRNALRHWIEDLRLPPPDRRHLEQIERAVAGRAEAGHLVAWPGAQIRRYRDRLFAMAPLPQAPGTWSAAWRPPEPLELPGGGRLIAEAAVGEGLAADSGDLTVRFRKGGERLRLPGRAHSSSLKTALQEAGVPPWVRERLPLVYAGESIAAVADLWVCQGFRAGDGERGWQLSWHGAPPGWHSPRQFR